MCYCLVAFPSSEFFKLGVPRKFWMSSFLGSNLTRFGVIVIERSCLEGRWRGARNLVALFLKISVLLIRGRYHWALFMESRWHIIIQSCSSRSLQLWLNWYSFFAQKWPKNRSFWPENNNTFNQDFGIFLIFHPF